MVSRRDLLAAGVAAALPFECAAAPGTLDTHTHFYDPSRPEGVPWPPKTEPVLYRTVLPAEFRRMTAPLGVTGTIAVEASPWLEDNQWLLDLAKREPVIVGVVGNLDPAEAAFPRHLDRFAANPLFKGIRLNQSRLQAGDGKAPPASLAAGLKRIAAAGLQIDVLGGAAMLPSVVRASDAAPGLRIVIDHMPFDAPQNPRARAEYEAALGELGARKQVYAKVSGVLRRVDGSVPKDFAYYRPSLDALWTIFGPDRLIYASNWPVSDRMAPYSDVLEVVRTYFRSKGAEASAKYFRLNSLAAYRWKRTFH